MSKNIKEVIICCDCVYYEKDPIDGLNTCTGPMAYACTPKDFYCAGAKRRIHE